MFSGSSALAGQRSSKPNSRCIIYYFQWFFSRDKTIYNPLWLWTIYNPLCWNTKTLGKLDKKLSNFSNPFFFSLKKLPLKISNNCQENTSARTSFWIKIGLSCMLQQYFTVFVDEYVRFTLFRSSHSQFFFKISFF